jgi:hypothetical protein
MRNTLYFLTALALCVLLSPAARSDITLTGNAYIDSDGDIKYISGGALVLADDGTGDGSHATPYVYDLGAQNLDLAGHYIRGAINDTSNQRSARYVLNGSVLGNGSFYSAPIMSQNGREGGSVLINANGSISVAHVWSAASYGTHAGSIALIATNGPVHVTGYLDASSEGPEWQAYNAGNVTVRSDGTGRGITITGQNGDGNSIRADGYVRYAGDVKLFTQGDVRLAGGIATKQEGDVTIRGDSAGTTLAGAVVISNDIYTAAAATYHRAGNVLVQAASLYLDGDVIANSAANLAPNGNVDVNVTGDCVIEGYITAGGGNHVKTPPGHVIITAHHIFVNGTNPQGQSITTDCEYTGDFDDGTDVQYDGDIRLTATNPVKAKFDLENPLLGETSTISIAGKLITERDPDQVTGHVILKAVELHLGDDIETETGSSIGIHYGQEDYGIVTHLTENDVQWTKAAHNISYINGTATFYDDMPYAGILTPPATVFFVR